LRSCDKSERRLGTKEREDIFDVKRRKRGSKRICGGIVEKRVY